MIGRFVICVTRVIHAVQLGELGVKFGLEHINVGCKGSVVVAVIVVSVAVAVDVVAVAVAAAVAMVAITPSLT
jgi:hypothetical protein